MILHFFVLELTECVFVSTDIERPCSCNKREYVKKNNGHDRNAPPLYAISGQKKKSYSKSSKIFLRFRTLFLFCMEVPPHLVFGYAHYSLHAP